MRDIRPALAHALGLSVLLAACGTAPTTIGGAAGPAAEAPTLRVGDRWVYRASDGYRQKLVWEETHAITAVGSDGIHVDVTLKGPSIDIARSEVLAAPGVVRSGAVYEAETDRFDPALIRYRYPLTNGARWSQRVRDLGKPPGPYGPIDFDATVGGYESVTTPAGTFSAIKIRYLIQLDDETFWRYPTQCNYVVWYAPAAGQMVREEKQSYYMEKGDAVSAQVPGQYSVYELVSFTRGR
jgi:hypothetical protein